MLRPRILVVDDETSMRRVLFVALRSQGYDVTEAATGQQALTELRLQQPDAIVLDLGLPDMDGVEVARAVRQSHQTPVIVVSARGEEQQQIRALDAGANDYVTKPFREGELMARIRAALRHSARGAQGSEIQIAELRIDSLHRRVFVRDREIDLTPTEFKLLHVLAREAGRVVTHERLLRQVWGPNQVDEVQYLRVYMKQLRKKIEDDPASPKRILTTAGVGYRLAQA